MAEATTLVRPVFAIGLCEFVGGLFMSRTQMEHVSTTCSRDGPEKYTCPCPHSMKLLGRCGCRWGHLDEVYI